MGVSLWSMAASRKVIPDAGREGKETIPSKANDRAPLREGFQSIEKMLRAR
jgi:hypothetical protein